MEQASLIIGDGNWAVKSGSLLGYTMFNEQFYPQDITASRATTATRVDENGLIVTSSIGIARIDYSTGEAALLVEPQRTNLALRSEEFDSAPWFTNNASITANATLSPNGIQNADAYIANGVSAQHMCQQVISVTTGTTYVLSLYVKKDTNNFVQIVGSGGVFGVNALSLIHI